MDSLKRKQKLLHLKKIAPKGGKALVAKRGTDYMRTIGSKGGKKNWSQI